jgi:hypothetical protein
VQDSRPGDGRFQYNILKKKINQGVLFCKKW